MDRVILVALAALLAGCMPLPGAVRGHRAADGAAAPSAPKTLTVAVAGEPTHFIFDFGSTGFGSVGNADLAQAVHQGLTSHDDRGVLLPVLAADIRSREHGTWTIRPDGTMQTLYRLRPGVAWHDGTPFRAESFAFGWTLTSDPELPISGSGSVVGLVNRVVATDDLTLAVEWASTYPFAHALHRSAMPAVPAHILEATYRSDKTHLPELAYWTREFVGWGA